MSKNEQTKQENCFIEQQIEQAINYMKTHKTLLIVTISINLCIMAFLLVLWLLYAHALPELKNTDKLSAVFNFFVAFGTTLLALYGWFGYKNQKSKEYIKDKRTIIITTNLRAINQIILKYDLTFNLIKRFIEKKDITLVITRRFRDEFKREYNRWNKDLNDLLLLIYNLRDYQPIASCLFPELSLFGVPLEDLTKLSSCMTDTIASINDLQNSIYDIQKKISEYPDRHCIWYSFDCRCFSYPRLYSARDTIRNNDHR